MFSLNYLNTQYGPRTSACMHMAYVCIGKPYNVHVSYSSIYSTMSVTSIYLSAGVYCSISFATCVWTAWMCWYLKTYTLLYASSKDIHSAIILNLLEGTGCFMCYLRRRNSLKNIYVIHMTRFITTNWGNYILYTNVGCIILYICKCYLCACNSV